MNLKVKVMRPKGSLLNFTLIAYFLLSSLNIYSQNELNTPTLNFEKFQLPDGQRSNSIQSIVQDQFGFMWYASKNGLHRWDGYQFKTYRHDPNDSTSIGGNYVEKIFVSNNGSLWIGLGGGLENGLLDFYDYNTETFQHYNFAMDETTNQNAYFVVDISEDTNSSIWVGTHFGVYRLNTETGKFKQYLNDPKDPRSLSHNICRSVFKDSKGTLWFGTGLWWDQSSKGGLNRYLPETDDFVHYFHEPKNINSLKSNIITALFEDSKSNFWVGTTNGGLHKMNRQEGTFERISYDTDRSYQLSIPIKSSDTNTFVQFMHEDQQQKLWVGYYNKGVISYDLNTKLTQSYESDKNESKNLPEKYIWSMFQSRDETLWGSTTGPESTVYKIKEKKFSSYKLESSTNYIGSFSESKENKLWLGTFEKGLVQIDLNSNNKKLFNPKSIVLSTYNFDKLKIDETLLATDQILKMIDKIIVDGSGGLWMTKKLLPGLIYFNPDTQNLKIYLHDPEDSNSIGNGIVTDILVGNRNQIWTVTSNGILNLYDSTEDNFKSFRYSELNKDEIKSGYNSRLMMTNKGKVFLAATSIKKGQLSNIFTHFDLVKKEFQLIDFKFTNDQKEKIDNEIRNIDEDTNGNIWVCNKDCLISLAPTTGLVNVYPAQEFYSEYFKGMALDNRDNLWLIGNNISFFSPQIGINSKRNIATNSIKNFPDFKLSIFKDSNGLIYIGGDGEFQYFNPNQFLNFQKKAPPKTIISNFELLNDKRKNKVSFISNIRNNSKINLNYNQNTFSLRFAALNFQEPSKNRIQCKLKGFDENWRSTGLEPKATYIKVPQGEYTFQVRGATLTSDWGDVKQIGIIIAPPIWGTWWAYALYFLSGLSLLYTFYRFQLNRKLEKAEALRLKDLDSAKNRLFTNITHEFRTPLTVISGMSEQIKENPDKWLSKGLNVINRNSNRLNNLVSQMLDLSKLESGKMKLNKVQSDIIPFVKYLCESFNSSSEASQLKLMVYAEVEELIMDFDSSKLSTVIINLLSNAIKFTSPGGKIIVHLNSVSVKGKSHFLIKVKDSGSGISQDELENIFNRFYQVDSSSTRTEEGTGIGLALTKELVELMDGNIHVNSKLGKGSEFTVQLPITRNAVKTNDVSLPFKPEIIELDETITTLDEDTEGHSELPIALIIEDNKDVAQYLKICLEERHHVLYAMNGNEGLEMAYERIPDIVISDVMMPGKDGFEVCSSLKKDERTDHIPVILLTAKSTLKDRISGLSHGADAYLTKPFSKVELFTRLDQLMLLRKNLMKRVQNDSYVKLLKKQVEGAEANFLKKIIKQIHEHMSDHSFGTAQLAHKVGFSESQIYRKLKAITGKSTALFIRSVRLQRAKELILTTDQTISEISYDVGFNDPAWFSRVFKEEFGFTPSDISK